VAQAKHLWNTVNRPNLMVKIPATKAGIPAIRQAIAAGINVNVTLIFSIDRYKAVMDAYMSGLEDHLLAGGDIEKIHSVASFFVSRVDSKIDPRLPVGSVLLGKAAIANAKLAYEEFRKTFGEPRFGKLQLAKANFQRPLWASTSSKNPAYSDTIYVDNLIGPATVNTVPPATLDAFRDHGKAALTIMDGVDECRSQIAELEKIGIRIDGVTTELEVEGVKSFADAFTALLQTVDERRAGVVARLGDLADPVARRIAQLTEINAVERMWNIDPTLWTEDPAGQDEIKKRLGWLDLPETSRAELLDINTFAAHAHDQGFSHFLLLGMGGSSLAPEVISLTFALPSGIKFAILDSTDPGQLLSTAADFPLEKTMFIVSSKSGGTAEIMAMFNYFWAQCEKNFGQQAGRHFIAITDPDTSLQSLAVKHGFAKIFNANPLIGGRYSALTHFGLVPAALMGIDPAQLLDRAAWMSAQCGPQVPVARNPGLVLGAVLGQAAQDGRDKLTLVADDALISIGSWMEQLIAESSGKLGFGIVPVDLEPLGKPSVYGNDRLFVYLRKDGKYDSTLSAIQQSGQPVLVFEMPDPYDLGAEFYRWEVATAIACAIFGINAFDQPDVQDAKDRTNRKIVEYKKAGYLAEDEPAWQQDGWKIFSHQPVAGASLHEILKAYLAGVQEGDYVAINAYVPRNPAIASMLTDLRVAIRGRTGCATTVGFGPRFQHSTGQLHKGGVSGGVFLQITADAKMDVEIPTQGMSFAVLEHAQSLGDYEALAARNRLILRIHMPSPEGIKKLLEFLE
jgi:transaldolase/glucose-6-phosphate isomerase